MSDRLRLRLRLALGLLDNLVEPRHGKIQGSIEDDRIREAGFFWLVARYGCT